MDPVMVTEAVVMDQIRCSWARWRRSRHYYVGELMWWEWCVKPHFKRLHRQKRQSVAQTTGTWKTTSTSVFMTSFSHKKRVQTLEGSSPNASDIYSLTSCRSHFCGIPGNSIQDAISCVRDVLAHADATGIPLCVITLDLQQTFYRISHQYLLHILHRYESMDCGMHTCLVRPGNGVGANK
jgi:hypothetical protein